MANQLKVSIMAAPFIMGAAWRFLQKGQYDLPTYATVLIVVSPAVLAVAGGAIYYYRKQRPSLISNNCLLAQYESEIRYRMDNLNRSIISYSVKEYEFRGRHVHHTWEAYDPSGDHPDLESLLFNYSDFAHLTQYMQGGIATDESWELLWQHHIQPRIIETKGYDKHSPILQRHHAAYCQRPGDAAVGEGGQTK